MRLINGFFSKMNKTFRVKLKMIILSEKMSVNSPLGRYIGVSSYKGGHFFTLIIHVLWLCVGYCIAVGEGPIVKSFG